MKLMEKKSAILFFIMLSLSVFLIKPNIEWDEYVYLMNAKNFAGEAAYFEANRSPILPLMASIFFRLGIGDFILPILPLIILAFFFFSLFLLSRDFKPMILMLCFPIFLLYSQKLMTSALAASFCLLSIYFIKKYFKSKKNLDFFASFLSCSLAFLSRYPLGIMALAISLIYLIFEKKRDYLKLIAGILAFSLPIIIWINFIGFEQTIIYLRYVSDESGFFYFFINFFIILGITPLAFAFIKNYSYEKNDLFFLMPIALIFLVFQSISHKEPRFMIPILPFISIFLSKIIKEKHFLAIASIFFLVSLSFSAGYYLAFCDNSGELNEISSFFEDKEKEMSLSNFWPIFSYYSGNPVLAIAEPCNIAQRVIDSNAKYIAISEHNPCFNEDYSNYELIKEIDYSCEIIRIYKI